VLIADSEGMRIEHGLRRLAEAFRIAGRAGAAGALAGRTGRPYGRARLAESEFLEPDTVGTTRAYPVPALIGAVLAAPTEADLPTALEALLRERVTTFDWRVELTIDGPLRKYGFLHTSIRAPSDGRHDDQMWLELAGYVVVLGGASVAAGQWLDVRPPSAAERLDTALAGPIEISITVATFSNTRYLGVGVPLYS
jgi:hypothetical protein